MFPFPSSSLGPYGQYGNLGLYGALVAYGSLNLTDASPSQQFVEPMEVADVGKYLSLSPSQIEDQADMLLALITAARVQAEIKQNRDLVRKQWDLSLDYWPEYRIKLRGPLASVDLVQTKDFTGATAALIENTDYVVDLAKQPGEIRPMFNRTWPSFTPWPTSALLIRFTSGYTPDSAFWSDTGAQVRVGMKYLISGWFNERIPFALGASVELPYSIDACLSYGAVPRVG